MGKYNRICNTISICFADFLKNRPTVYRYLRTANFHSVLRDAWKFDVFLVVYFKGSALMICWGKKPLFVGNFLTFYFRLDSRPPYRIAIRYAQIRMGRSYFRLFHRLNKELSIILGGVKKIGIPRLLAFVHYCDQCFSSRNMGSPFWLSSSDTKTDGLFCGWSMVRFKRDARKARGGIPKLNVAGIW